MFNALVVEKDDEGKTNASVQRINVDRLPAGDVTVAVEYSTVNYKDGLCIGPGGGLVRNYPHVPGIDFAGTVEHSEDPRYKPGDKVVLTGWRVGEIHWGGYATRARVKASLPTSIESRGATQLEADIQRRSMAARYAAPSYAALDACQVLDGETARGAPVSVLVRNRG